MHWLNHLSFGSGHIQSYWGGKKSGIYRNKYCKEREKTNIHLGWSKVIWFYHDEPKDVCSVYILYSYSQQKTLSI